MVSTIYLSLFFELDDETLLVLISFNVTLSKVKCWKNYVKIVKHRPKVFAFNYLSQMLH